MAVSFLVDMKDFYESRAWKKMKVAVLRRDGYRCQHCKRYGRMTEAQVVHHIQHLDEHPELALDPKNLISLCIGCHNKEHPEKAVAGGRSRR